MNVTYTEQVMNWFHEVNELYDGTLNKPHHLFYSTDIATNETFTFRESMKQEDRLSFLGAMENEIRGHEEGVHWTVLPFSTLLNKARPIKSVWSFKRKLKPDGDILNHKSRLCAHDGIQKWGDSYWGTYFPVVNMLTVRLIIAISKIYSLDSKSIDFVLVFPQADLKEDIWMKLTIGFQVGGQK